MGLVRGTQVVYLFIMARWLTTDQMGYVQTLGLGISLVIGVATPWIVWVMIQKTLAARDTARAVGTMHQMATYAILAGSILAPVLALLYLARTPSVSLPIDGTLLVLTALAMCFYQLVEGAFSAVLKVDLGLILGGARVIANYLIPLTLFFLTRNISMIFVGWLIADTLALLFGISKCGLRRKAALYRPRLPSKDLVVFTLPIFLLYFFGTLRTFLDPYITLFFFGTTNLAVYNNVSGLTSIASEAILTLLIPFLPVLTTLLRSRPERLGVALGVTVKMLALAILFVVPLFIFAGTPIILTVLSEKYVTAQSPALLAVASITMIFYVFHGLFANIRGAKGETLKLMLFEFSYDGAVILFYALFAYLGWLQTLGIIGVALCAMLGYFVAFCYMASQTKELGLLGRSSLARIALLSLPQTGAVFLLSLLLAPIDLFDFGIMAAIAFLLIVVLSAAFSCFNDDELEILSRVSKRRLDSLIRLYQRAGLRRSTTREHRTKRQKDKASDD